MQNNKQLLLANELPAFADELQQLLTEQGEPGLAAQVPSLRIYERCRCGDDDICCGTFYTQPVPAGSFGPGHRNLRLFPEDMALMILANAVARLAFDAPGPTV